MRGTEGKSDVITTEFFQVHPSSHTSVQMILVYTFGVNLIGSQVYSMIYRVTAVLANPSAKRRFLSWPVVAGFQLLILATSAGLSYAVHIATMRDTVSTGETPV